MRGTTETTTTIGTAVVLAIVGDNYKLVASHAEENRRDSVARETICPERAEPQGRNRFRVIQVVHEQINGIM